MKSHGGEGKGAYKGTKNDSSLGQIGGEGKSIGKKTDIKMPVASAGPGKNLKVTKN